MMPVSHDDVIADLPPDRRGRIEARTGELLAAEEDSGKSPIGGLIAHVIEEYRQGKAISLEAYAARHNITLTDE